MPLYPQVLHGLAQDLTQFPSVFNFSYYTYCCHNTEIDRQGFKFSVLKTFNNFKLLSNFNEVQTYSLKMIC